MAFASEAAGRGHNVTLFEKDPQLGGQFNLAKVVPGKEEFYETIRYYKNMLELNGVDVRLGVEATPELLQGFDSIVLATGNSLVPQCLWFMTINWWCDDVDPVHCSYRKICSLCNVCCAVLAPGVTARAIPLPVKTNKVQVVSYTDILTGAVRAGRKVAVIGGTCDFLRCGLR